MKLRELIIEKLNNKKSDNIITQEEFNKAFNDILKGSTYGYLDPKTGKVSRKKTSRIEVLDKNGKLLLDYDTDLRNPHFWYHYDRVYYILRDQFSLESDEIQSLMKSIVEEQYKMKGTTPIRINSTISVSGFRHNTK